MSHPTPAAGPDRRRENIVAYVTRHGTARVEELARHFDVSQMTVHRDLDALAADHLLERVRGGARSVTPSMSELGVGQRRQLHRGTKLALCTRAAELISEGDTVAVDDSTTLEPLIGLLPDRQPSALITHSLAAMHNHSLRTGVSGIRLVGCGGLYIPETDSFLGAGTTEALHKLSADITFVSTTSLRPTATGTALFHPDIDAADTKSALIDIGTMRVLVVDSTKFDAPGVFKVADLADFHHIVVDAAVGPENQARLADSGAQIHTVNVEETH